MTTQLVIAVLFLAALNMMAEPFADLSFDAAVGQAGQTGKLVLVDFYTTWCGPCKMLDKNTWTDAEVIKLLAQKTVALRLDAEVETNLALRFKINAYPTVLLLKPDGTEIDRLVGYRDPKTFIADFNAALSGKDAVARAKEDLLAAGTNDPMARLKYGRTLAQKGKDAEALPELLWCFDHGLETSPSFSGVRLSFLLNEIANLARRSPAARKALEDRRDERQTRALAGSVDQQTVLDLVSLNKALRQKEKNLVVFDQIPASSPLRAELANQIVDQLLENKRYADVLSGQDAQAIFRAQSERCQQALGGALKDNPMREHMEQSLRAYVVNKGASFFEALAGLKKNEQARDLAQDILKFDNSAETHSTLVAAANRVANAEMAQLVK
jgi:thiol-disulfide isomerase/thioredoxin